MKQKNIIQIKHKVTGKVIKEIKAETLSEADLSKADLRWADLRWADLSEANLRWADLRGGDLRGAKGTFIFNWGVKLKLENETKK